jgi:hypothetical protein
MTNISLCRGTTILTIIIDAVIRASTEQLTPSDKTTIIFYADGGFIGGHKATTVQRTLNAFVKNFKTFGLLMNAEKTKSMTMFGSKPVHRISNDAYNRRITREGKTCQEKQQTMVTCEYCEENVQKKSITQHNLSKKCRNIQRKLPNNQQEVRMYCTLTTPTLLVTPYTITISMDNDTNVPCPHEDCPYYTNKRDCMRRHYRARHPNNIITIAEECLLPQCNNCGLFQGNTHTKQQMDSNECKQYTEIKRKRRQERIQNAATHVNFRIDNQPVKKKLNSSNTSDESSRITMTTYLQ